MKFDHHTHNTIQACPIEDRVAFATRLYELIQRLEAIHIEGNKPLPKNSELIEMAITYGDDAIEIACLSHLLTRWVEKYRTPDPVSIPVHCN